MKKFIFSFILISAFMLFVFTGTVNVKAAEIDENTQEVQIDNEETKTLSSSSGSSSSSTSDIGESLPFEVVYEDGELINYVKKGDIVYVDKGPFHHSSIVEGIFYDDTYNQDYIRVIEAVFDKADGGGGVSRGVLTPDEFDSKRMEIYRLTDASQEQIDGAVEFASDQVGKEYSTGNVFSPGKHSDKDSKKWYCSELVWASYYSQGICLDTVGENSDEDNVVYPREIRDYINATKILDYEHETTIEDLGAAGYKYTCDGETYWQKGNDYLEHVSGYTYRCRPTGHLNTEYMSIFDLRVNCRTIDQNSMSYCEQGYCILLNITVDCAKSYKFTSSSPSYIEMSCYNVDGDLVASATMSDTNCTGVITEYLAKGTYYIKINFANPERGGYIGISYQATYPIHADEVYYNTENNALTHLYLSSSDTGNLENNLCYINSRGAGFYNITLMATKTDGTAVTYPNEAIKVYDASDEAEEYKYDVYDYSALAENDSGENSFCMYLSRNGKFYIHINMPDAVYDSMTLLITSTSLQTIDISSRMTSTFTDTLFTEDEVSDYAKMININQTGEYNLNFTTSNTITGNMTVLLFKKSFFSEYSYSQIDKAAGYLTNSTKTRTFEVTLDAGEYYVGYFNNTNGAMITSSLTRLLENNSNRTTAMVADPDSDYDSGSEVEYNNGLTESYTITEGFTRNLYFLLGQEDILSVSRLKYDWYSSNDNIATVSSYGTVFAKNVTSNTSVTIYAVYKENPSYIYYKIFNILNDVSTEPIEIQCNMSYSYLEENGTYKIELNSTNSPYPWLQYYTWSIVIPCQKNSLLVSIGAWGEVTSTGTGSATLTGQYTINPRVSVVITLTITE
ncbi:MAG: YiiX/YebB-like N1pC/P60 family cysteine hydrolase [Bacilli bacterium]